MGTAYVENRFEYRGFPCVVIFQTMGHRCGYVGLQKSSKYYGKDYGKIPVECHCGLTYADDELFEQTDKDIWWIGFDCAHMGDGGDFESAKKYFSNDKEVMEEIEYFEKSRLFRGEIRTQEFVENECRKIVDQLIEGED